MNLEDYFISQFKSKKIGDDGAVIGDMIYSKDAFFENVHFKTSWMSHYQIAKKAMYVNISDAIAMNAKPKYALLSVAMPSSISKEEMRELVRGFEEVANEFGIDIIGGDTLSNTKLDITVTIISQTKKPLRRSGTKVGDLFAYTGELGKSKKDLKRLMNLGNLHKQSKFVDIKLRESFVSRVTKYVHSGMDISDGLLSDIHKLCKASGVGFELLHPLSKDMSCSGEEYEMLISFDRRDRKKIQRIAQATRTSLHIFAYAARQKTKFRCKAHHF